MIGDALDPLRIGRPRALLSRGSWPSRELGGTDLAIDVKHLVGAMGGDVDMTPVPQGSIFYCGSQSLTSHNSPLSRYRLRGFRGHARQGLRVRVKQLPSRRCRCVRRAGVDPRCRGACLRPAPLSQETIQRDSCSGRRVEVIIAESCALFNEMSHWREIQSRPITRLIRTRLTSMRGPGFSMRGHGPEDVRR